MPAKLVAKPPVRVQPMPSQEEYRSGIVNIEQQWRAAFGDSVYLMTHRGSDTDVVRIAIVVSEFDKMTRWIPYTAISARLIEGVHCAEVGEPVFRCYIE